MTDQIQMIAISTLGGVVLALQEAPSTEMVDKIGMASIAVALIYWMLNGFNKRLDKLTEAIDKLRDGLQK